MEIYIYFGATLLAFISFLGLPLFLIKPRNKKGMIYKLVDHRELRNIFLQMDPGEKMMHYVQKLVNATSVEMQKLGNQNYFELRFNSFRESLNFKKTALLAGICMESHITILNNNKEFQVIFIAQRKTVGSRSNH